MKKRLKMPLVIACFLLLLTACSSDRDDENTTTEATIEVALSVNVSLTDFDRVMVRYTNENEQLVTETLSSNRWNRELTVPSGFELVFNVFGSGSPRGRVEVEASAEENNSTILSFERLETSEFDFDFNIEVRRTL